MLTGCALLTGSDIKTAAESGFDYVEFMGKYLVCLTREEYGKLRGQLDRAALAVLGINGYCPKEITIAGPGFDPSVIRSYAQLCAQRAGGIAAKFAGIGSPYSRRLPKGFSRTAAMRQLKEFLKITAAEFEPYGITVCLEPLAPCYCNFINYLPEAAAVIGELNQENIRLVADFYNMEYVGEADLNLKPWIGSIAHVHISDDDGAPDKRSFLKPEKAELHQRRLQGLYAAGYQGAVSLELDVRLERQRAKQSCKILAAVSDRKEKEEGNHV